MLRLSDEVPDGIVFMNEAKNLMYISFYSDELETEGDFKGRRKFDEDLQFVVMWANNIEDVIDGKAKSVPIKKRDKSDDTVQGYLSANKARNMLYLSFFGDEIVEEGEWKGRRKFDPNLSFILRWADNVKDMIAGNVKSLKIYKKRPRNNN